MPKKPKCKRGTEYNRKTKSCDVLPASLKAQSDAAYSAASKAHKTNTKAAHKAAMQAHDGVGRAAIKLGFDDFGDVHKGQAHDHWVAQKNAKLEGILDQLRDELTED